MFALGIKDVIGPSGEPVQAHQTRMNLVKMVEAGRIELPSKTVAPSTTTSVSPVLISTSPSVGATWMNVQPDFFRSPRYKRKLSNRSGFY